MEGFRYGFERLWERVIGLEMCDYCLLYGLDIVSDLAKVQVGLDSSYQRISHLTVHSAAEYRSGEENGCELSISAKE